LATRLQKNRTMEMPTMRQMKTCQLVSPRAKRLPAVTSADAVHVRHPEREDVVPGPVLVPQRREVVVREARVVGRFDHADAGGMLRARRRGCVDGVGPGRASRTLGRPGALPENGENIVPQPFPAGFRTDIFAATVVVRAQRA